jgi:uroporphyrinogen decarboxylase
MSSSASDRIRSDEQIRSLTTAEKEAIIRRFNERLDGAIAGSPPSKAWVRQAMSRGGAPRCPCRFRRLTFDIILRYGDALADLFCAYPDDMALTQAYDPFVGYQPAGTPEAINPVEVLTQGRQWFDEWGTGWGHAEGGVGASPFSHPIRDWSQLDDYLARRMPDARAPGRLDAAVPAVRRHSGTHYFFAMAQNFLFERFHMLRGMENAFTDFHLYPSESDRLLDALTDYFVELIRSWGELGGLDAMLVTDDLGTQRSLMISPATWKKFFAARCRRIFDEAHRHGMQVLFHSCGNVAAVIGDLIDVGVDIIDPLQPEAMDVGRVAREFAGKVAFSGGLSNQRLVEFTPQETRDHVRRTIDAVGGPSGNAFIIAPSNMMSPDIPLENLEALFETAHNP